jgi:hypothetical protein
MSSVQSCVSVRKASGCFTYRTSRGVAVQFTASNQCLSREWLADTSAVFPATSRFGSRSVIIPPALLYLSTNQNPFDSTEWHTHTAECNPSEAALPAPSKECRRLSRNFLCSNSVGNSPEGLCEYQTLREEERKAARISENIRY